jgi:3'-phosphoadenosine 5'-phosphosulfate sulfotransferase (PAPS reductase)/FAD synthetase
MDPNDYDRVVIASSGGKDSLACILHVLDCKVPKEKIELWHHRVDGTKDDPQGNSPQFGLWDWPCTDSYNEELGKALGIPVYFSWRQGGITREMFRENELTAPTMFDQPDGTIGQAGGIRGKKSTRRKFPQVSADLQTRWCSSAAKIDVASIALGNQERFRNIKTLFVTGERAEENGQFRALAKQIGHEEALKSPELKGRAAYADLEPHRADLRDGIKFQRHIDHWRPVRTWTEERVWETIERYKILVHPAYRLGWGRLSCMTCIFGSPSQWASVNEIDPERAKKFQAIEEEFGYTMHRNKTIEDRIKSASPYANMNPLLVAIALSDKYEQPIFTENWELPAGAFGESAGPT